MDIKKIRAELETLVIDNPENRFYQRTGLPMPSNRDKSWDYNRGVINLNAYGMGILFGREAYLEQLLQTLPAQDETSEEAQQEV